MNVVFRLPRRIGILLGIVFLLPYLSCTQRESNGASLSHTYCASCHLYPEPSLLQREIWINSVLPEMGLRLGIGDKNTLLNRMPLKQFDHLMQLGIYPDTPQLSLQNWQAIVTYYSNHSPILNPTQAQKEPVTPGGNLFTPMPIPVNQGEISQTTLVRFVPSRQEIWLGSRQKEIQIFDLDGKIKWKFRTPSPIVDAFVDKESAFLAIGNMLPNEDRNGRLFTMDEKGGHPKLLLDSLHRPVQLLRTDLDKDGAEDWIIAEFGWETGQVRVVNGKSGATNIISSQPGARNIQVKDLDADGLPDLFILFAQAREQVSYFHNEGRGIFKEKVIINFPSVYGSSYLEMADMNKDGFVDLIIANGDNADYSIVAKAFHGVRIYLNDGKGKYTEKWFYPSYGATKAIARDFDRDGDLDIALIGFFSEPDQHCSFLYFENRGGLQFKPWSMNVPDGRWLVMESSDMDSDGDEDLILGNFLFGSENSARKAHDIQALVLKNSRITGR